MQTTDTSTNTSETTVSGSTDATPTNPTFTTADDIAANEQDALSKGATVTIKFAPVTAPVWTRLNGLGFTDGEGQSIAPNVLAAIIAEKSIEFSVRTVHENMGRNDDCTRDKSKSLYELRTTKGGDVFYASTEYIAEMTLVSRGPRMVRIDNLSPNVEIYDNKLHIYGNDLSRAQVLSALRTFADQLGCTMTQSTKTIALKAVEPVSEENAAELTAAMCKKIRNDGGNTTYGKIAVRFKPITDKCWASKGNGISDAARETIRARILLHVVQGTTVEFGSVRAYGEYIRFGSDDVGTMYASEEYIETLSIDGTTRGASVAKFDGLDGNYDMAWHSDKSLKVGCQRLSARGVMQMFELLAQFNGYTITDVDSIAKANKIEFTHDANTVVKAPVPAK